MGRIHLFEFEDKKWFPSNIRNYMTDFLQFVANQFDFYRLITPVLKKGLESVDSNQIIDLASGGGGGWKSLSKHIEKELPDVKVNLTDFYPNKETLSSLEKEKPTMFKFVDTPVDATNVPENLVGLRTQFLSLHHFKPDGVKAIFGNAIAVKMPIVCFEAQSRSVGDFIKFFFSPINVLLTTPFIRPFNFGRLFFTYIIPLVPLFTWWDGLVSVLRTYSKKELEQLLAEMPNSDEFNWEIDKIKTGQVWIYYILGTPKY